MVVSYPEDGLLLDPVANHIRMKVVFVVVVREHHEVGRAVVAKDTASMAIVASRSFSYRDMRGMVSIVMGTHLPKMVRLEQLVHGDEEAVGTVQPPMASPLLAINAI